MEHDERACRALLQRWHREGDRAARDELAERLLPLAHGLARRYAGKGEPLDDLEQVACVGPAEGDRPLRLRARGPLRHLRRPDDRGRDQAPLPRPRLDAARPARRPGAHGAAQPDARGAHPRCSAARRASRSSRRPRRATPEQVVEALHAPRPTAPMSLDAPDGRGRRRRPPTALGGDDGGFERTEQRLLLRGGFDGARARASARSCACASSRGSPSARSPTRVGISQMHVSRLIRRSLDELRAAIDVPAATPRARAGAGDGRRRLTGTPRAPWRSTPRTTAPRPTRPRTSRSSATASSSSCSTSCASRCPACRSSSGSC